MLLMNEVEATWKKDLGVLVDHKFKMSQHNY